MDYARRCDEGELSRQGEYRLWYINYMKTSTGGLAIIKEFEGLRLTSYLCQAGIPTIGWGTTKIGGKPVKLGLTITQAQAEEYLKNDVFVFEAAVNILVKRPINQNQFDALVSFCYNLGYGALASSTLLKKVNANPNDISIRNEFQKWVYGGGKALPGLVRRRNAEADLYFKPIV